jgi:hypothetical protein
MTVNFTLNNIIEGTEPFYIVIKESIEQLLLNKGVKFKTSIGVLGVYNNKKMKYFSITLNGAQVETVKENTQAIESVLKLYKSLS